MRNKQTEQKKKDSFRLRVPLAVTAGLYICSHLTKQTLFNDRIAVGDDEEGPKWHPKAYI